MQRMGGWVQTHSGRSFYPMDPSPDDISIKDIAHSLAFKCRFNGHCTKYYSVAEHCILVSQHVPDVGMMPLWGLLHDAAKAYTADVPRPLKAMLPGWQAMEAGIMRAVVARFGLCPEAEPAAVRAVDAAMLATERAAIMAPSRVEWGDMPQPIVADIRCLPPEAAKILFLNRFMELAGRQ